MLWYNMQRFWMNWEWLRLTLLHKGDISTAYWYDTVIATIKNHCCRCNDSLDIVILLLSLVQIGKWRHSHTFMSVLIAAKLAVTTDSVSLYLFTTLLLIITRFPCCLILSCSTFCSCFWTEPTASITPTRTTSDLWTGPTQWASTFAWDFWSCTRLVGRSPGKYLSELINHCGLW